MKEPLHVSQDGIGKLLFDLSRHKRNAGKLKAASALFKIKTDEVPISQRAIHLEIHSDDDFQQYITIIDDVLLAAHVTFVARNIEHTKSFFCSRSKCDAYSLAIYMKAEVEDTHFYTATTTLYPNLRSLSVIDEQCLLWFQKAPRLEEIRFSSVVSVNFHAFVMPSFISLRRVYVTRPGDTSFYSKSTFKIFLTLTKLERLEYLVFLNQSMKYEDDALTSDDRPSPSLRTLILSHLTHGRTEKFIRYIGHVKNLRYYNDVYDSKSFDRLTTPRVTDYSGTLIQNLTINRPSLILSPHSLLYLIREIKLPPTLKTFSVHLEQHYVDEEWVERISRYGLLCVRVTSHRWTKELLELLSKMRCSQIEIIDEIGEVTPIQFTSPVIYSVR